MIDSVISTEMLAIAWPLGYELQPYQPRSRQRHDERLIVAGAVSRRRAPLTATYRLQMNRGFTLRDATAQVEY